MGSTEQTVDRWMKSSHNTTSASSVAAQHAAKRVKEVSCGGNIPSVLRILEVGYIFLFIL
jgi:hypothetical protein